MQGLQYGPSRPAHLDGWSKTNPNDGIPKVSLYRIAICIYVIVLIGLRGDTHKSSWDVATKPFSRQIVRVKFYSVKTHSAAIRGNDEALRAIMSTSRPLPSLSAPSAPSNLCVEPFRRYCPIVSARMALSGLCDLGFYIPQNVRYCNHRLSSVPHSAGRSLRRRL